MLLLRIPAIMGQAGNIYRLDIYSGLPANHVYSALVDKNGYLWLCTTNGVARYNGYELKTFSFSEGLPTNDVWGLHLDHKGRIWLRCNASRVGYIYKNRYHSVFLKTTDRSFYPRHISDYDSGVIFFNSGQRGQAVPALGIEKNDTVNFSATFSKNADVTNRNSFISSAPKGPISYHIVDGNGTFRTAKTCYTPSPGDSQAMSTILLNYLAAYNRNSNYLAFFHTDNCSEQRLLFYDNGKPDTISFADFYRQAIYIIARRNVYRIDPQLQVTDTFPIAQFNETLSGNDLTNFFYDSFWGKCATTSAHGIYFSFGTKNSFRKTDNDYLPAGNISDSIAVLWNERRHTIQFTGPGNTTSHHVYPQITGLRTVVRLDSTRSLLVADNDIFVLLHKTRDAVPLMQTIHHFVPQKAVERYGGTIIHTKSLAVSNSGDIYIGRNTVYSLRLKNDTAYPRQMTNDIEYYYGIETDGPGNTVWIYNNNRVVICDDSGRRLNVPDDFFRKAGISNIEQVMTDKRYGSILIKDREYLYLFDAGRASLQKLFYNYNLREAVCRLEHDRLVIAGRFGVLVSKITGRNRFSAPVVYPNVKNSMYLQVLTLVALRNSILLQTDAGNYELPMPADSAFTPVNSAMPQYRFIAEYADSVYDLAQHQTIPISQGNDRLQFDVINPQGNGRVYYYYRLSGTGDEAWHMMHTNELRLPLAEPGKTYTLSLAAGDDVWRSNSTEVSLYQVPYWWQTAVWRVVIAAAVMIAFAALLLLVILLTRYFVSRQNEKKQLLSDLKLRAIYAQINPHFIFNTLNVTQYFIRKKQLDEAYGHISKFSRLLWSYLESARNRYITVTDEVRNMRHYIELQQVRFEALFTYAIDVSPELETNTVKIPALLLQPIVENAINHGLVPKESDGRLRISFEKSGDRNIVITIDDNGVGRKKAAAGDNNPLKKKSYGNQLIKELVLLFNKYEKMSIDIRYIDKEFPQTGTTVIINIKQSPYDTATHENDQLRDSG